MYRIIFILIYSLLQAVTAQANTLEKTPVINAALAEFDYPPFYFVNGKHELTGISVDVLNHVSQQLGLQVHYQRLSWPRVLKSLENGEIDLVTTFFNTAERAPHVVYTGVPHAYEINHFFSLANEDIRYDGNLKSLASYRIGMIRGYSYGKVFDEAEYLLKERVLDEPTLVRMLLGNRFDLAIGNPFAIRLQLDKLRKTNQVVFLDPAVDKSPIYMAISRKYSDALGLAAKLTEAISDLKKTDKYKQWVKRYDL